LKIAIGYFNQLASIYYYCKELAPVNVVLPEFMVKSNHQFRVLAAIVAFLRMDAYFVLISLSLFGEATLRPALYAEVWKTLIIN
jgi:hypothetical protein